MARILLIDDDKDLVDAYRLLLSAKGHDIDTAASATEARKVLPTGGPFDLVVLDVMMETLTAGFDLAREIHDQWPKLPIVMVSAIRDTTNVPFKFEPDQDWLPVVRFVEKSPDPQAVVDQVEELLNATRA